MTQVAVKLCSKEEILEASFEKAKDMIAFNIVHSKRWLGRGLVAIYKRQTAEEQQSEATLEHNGMGFNGRDAKFLTSLAENLLRYGRLSEKQWDSCLNSMKKYCGQLAKIAQSK